MKFSLIVAFCLVAVMFVFSSCKKNGESIKAENANETATVEDVALKSDTTNASQAQIQVIDFYATWCGPCRKLSPIIEKMEKKYAGKINFSKIDIDENPTLAEKYGVSAIPTLVYIKGDTVVDTTVGLLSEDELDAKLSKLIAEE